MSFTVIFYAVALLQSHRSHYLYSCVPDGWKNNWTLVAFSVFEGYQASGNFSLVINFVSFTVSYFLSTTAWLFELQSILRKDIKCFLSKHQIYQYLRLLTIFFNDFASRVFVPIFTIYQCVFNMCALYGILKTYHSLPLLTYLMFPGAFIPGMFIQLVCYPECSKIIIFSSAVKNLMRSIIVNEEDDVGRNWRSMIKLRNVICKSMRPFGIEVASVCKVQLVTVLSMLELTFSGTLLILLNF
ncbi:unnamed protein product [Allacma fusca]|uniref:Uncharacterized protein n=1 Tax=Allacma fusca TaxID=39272 RepID=A0A8J2KDQ8_9HEXA|nr:unnamed protein product [Allacma fusca]